MVLLNKKLVEQIKEYSTVLEFGPASGAMTQYMTETLHCKVYIVEKDKEAFEEASKYAVDGLCDDIMSLKWCHYFSKIEFDYIIFADVLEHLTSPNIVVEMTSRLLKDTGYLLVSIPNIAHNDILINLYNDQFNYTANGLLDETHVHFWGRENLVPFFDEAGYSIIREEFNCVKTSSTEQRNTHSVIEKSVLNGIMNRPFGDVYQFIIICKKKGTSVDEMDRLLPTKLNSTNEIQIKLYLNYGKGYNEENALSVNICADEKVIHFSYRFNINPGAKSIRFDPVDKEFCIVRNIEIISDNGDVSIISHNGVKIGETYYFDNVDSQFELKIDSNSSFLDIEAEIFIVSTETEKKMLKKILLDNKEILDLKGELHRTNEKCQENKENSIAKQFTDIKADITNTLEKQHGILSEEMRALLINEASKMSLKIEEERKLELREIFSIIDNKNDELGELEVKNQYLEKELNKIKKFYSDLQAQFNEINNYNQSILGSTSWKVTGPLRKVGNMKKKYFDAIKTLDSSVKCNIESFNYSASILDITGWIAAKGNISKNAKILFRSSKEKTILGELGIILNERRDVSEFYSLNGKGFKIGCNIEFNGKLDILIEFQIDGKKKEALLGAVKEKDLPAKTFRVFANSANRGENSLDTLIGLNNTILDKKMLECSRKYPEFDIILPVYNGIEYFGELFQSIAKTKCRYRLIIIDDNSPDKRVEEYLKNISTKTDNVILLKNNQNLGFVKSVNRGLRLAEHHVILLNTDVVLPNNWMERLMYPILANSKVASTTPFTNCGTICSFPNFGEDNEIFENLTLDQIDNIFSKVLPQYPHMPTGVGFCMGINIDVLKEVGILDENTFSKGYGEENDWCQRAIEKGYYNIHVDNLFVYHKHGGSFLSEEKRQLLQRNTQLLLKKHPDYLSSVDKYCNLDPTRETRENVLSWLILSECRGVNVFVFNHSLGGGATSYLKGKAEKILNEGGKFVVTEYIPNTQEYKVAVYYKKINCTFKTNDYDDISQFLQSGVFDEIWINELVSYPNIYTIFDDLIQNQRKNGEKLKILLHDLFFICPAINMITNEGKFCELPSIVQCDSCARENEHNHYPDGGTISEYREYWKKIFKVADQIIAFSENTANIFEKVYGKGFALHIIPHEVDYLPMVRKNVKITPTINIGLLGVLNRHKGLEIVKSMLYFMDQNNLNVRIILIGECSEKISNEHFYCTGRYTRESLPKLVSELDIDIFFVTSIWPETFSYTTSEVMQMGLPIASFDLGAPADRIKTYEKGVIISSISAEVALNELMKYYYTNLQLPLCHKKVLFIVEYVSFASRYRVEHVKEQLVHYGINADIIHISEINKIIFGQYYQVVIYRATDYRRVCDVAIKAHRWNIPVFYDVDDFVFDYDAIQGMEFLSGDEYKDFREYCECVRKSMELCDGYITSTETLKEEIRKVFNNSPVFLKRNMSSMEMYIISKNCVKHRIREDSKIYLGYFSGSKTHNGDFSLISNVLKKLMEEDSRINLVIGGCLELPAQFDSLKKRITRFEFKDWRELPGEIAAVDINLMPLENSLFNSCKSENKWMEAALVKVPTIASFNRELNLVIKDKEDGFLCSSDQEWYDVIKLLCNDSALRNKVGEMAYEKVLHDYLTWSNANINPFDKN